MSKILMGTGSFPPDFGGASLRASRMSERMIQRFGHEYVVLCLGKRHNTDKAPAREIIRFFTFPEHGIWFPFHVADMILRVNWIMLTKAKQTELIHLFSLHWLNRIILLTNLVHRKPVVYEATLDGSDDPITLTEKGIRNRLTRKLTSYLLTKIDRIIVGSEEVKKTSIDKGIKPETLMIIPRPCDEQMFASIAFEQKDTLRQKLGIPRKKLVLLHIGRIQQRKNQLFLVETLGNMKTKDFLLILIGLPDEGKQYTYKVNNYITKNGMQDKVIMLGKKDNINEYMVASDLFVFASEKEGFPNAIAEAMMSGLPIITTPLPSINKYILPEVGVIVDNSDSFGKTTAKNFARAIELVADSKNRYYRELIRKSGFEYFASEKIDKIYNNIYQLLLRGANKK